MTFEAITTPKVWEILFDVAPLWEEEITFDIAPEGITFGVMDPSHVAMIKAKIDKSAFASYKVDTPQKISVLANEISSLLKKFPSDSAVKFFLDDEKKLRIEVLSDIERHYEFHTIDNPETPDTPKITTVYTNSLICSPQFLHNLIDGIVPVSPTITFEIDEKTFTVWAKGESGKSKAILRQRDTTEDSAFEIKATSSAKSTYDSSYILKLLNIAKKNAQEVKLDFETNAPLRLTLSYDNASVTMYLAPIRGED